MYIVGNRTFTTYEQAENYCNNSDFDPDTMIQKEEEKSIFWYELLFRGISPGCQPKGFIDSDNNRGKFGIVAYNRQLTESELKDYEMREYNEY